MDVIIIEDEDIAALSLENLLLKSDFNIHIKKRLESVGQAIEWLKINDCDLIFSDIHLGDGDSFEIFETLAIKTPIIFTTAFEKYALRSFQFSVVDYLLKPYDKEKLSIAIDKFLTINSQKNTASEVLEATNSNKLKKHQERFLVYKGKQLISINSNEVSYFMAQGKNLFLYIINGDSYLYEDTISNLEEKLSSTSFFKINRKYIVRHNAIKNIFKYSKNRIKIELNPNPNVEEIILVSSKKIILFKEWLNN
jgi:DNA-binding LytR/AlgR family response regulator